MKVLEFVKKHWRGILFVTYLFICAFVLGIGGLILQDYAKTPFWWNFWTVSPIAGVIGFIGGVWWFSKQKNISW